jgi:quercetin dioxygenase-like cupin family protein
MEDSMSGAGTYRKSSDSNIILLAITVLDSNEFSGIYYYFLTNQRQSFYIMMTSHTDQSLLLEKKNLYYPPGPEKKEEKYQGKFTNDDFDIREIVDANTSQEQEVYYVIFKKGCRTRPHIHATDQTLVAVKGRGIVVTVDKIDINSEGKSAIIKPLTEGSSSPSVIELSEGDVVCVPAGTLHWHGALENNSNESDHFSHLAIRKRTDTETIWF